MNTGEYSLVLRIALIPSLYELQHSATGCVLLGKASRDGVGKGAGSPYSIHRDKSRKAHLLSRIYPVGLRI